MSSHRILRALFATTALCGGGILAAPAWAQTASVPPVRASVDGNGVDLFLGKYNWDGPVLSAGQDGALGLSYQQFSHSDAGGDTVWAALDVSGGTVYVVLGGKTDRFTVSGSTYTNTEGDGATLALSGSVYTYVASDGTTAHFDNTKQGAYPYNTFTGLVSDLSRPDGAHLSYHYDSLVYCSSYKQLSNRYTCLQHATVYRIGSVISAGGYKLQYRYDPIDSWSEDDGEFPDFGTWSRQVGVTLSNPAVAGSPGRAQDFATTYSPGTTTQTITDAMGRVTTYRTGASDFGITRPGSTAEDVTVAYTSGRVSSVTNAAGTWTYGAPSDVSGVRTVTVTDPLSHATTYTFDIASQRMTSMTDALSHTTTMAYDTSGRPTRVTAPEGNYTQTTYDARGNVTETRQVAKSGSGLADIVSAASFDTTCTNPVTCNQPNSTTDPNGNTTDYTYDATTGKLLTVTAPAATTGGTRPKTSYSYTSLQAYYDQGTGLIVASGYPVALLTGVSTCQTNATCAGTADEVKTVIGYGAQMAGTGNNLLPVSVTRGAGDGSLSMTTATAYDAAGNVLSVDGPLSGTGDTTTYRYDADREAVGVIAPDPDGAGTRHPQAQRISYDDKGRVTLAETGTVTGTSDAAWAAFSSSQAVATTWDGVDRKLSDTLQSGGTAYGVTQYSYDHQRLDCVAVRMNSTAWGTLPGSACTAQTAGSAGPDRISKAAYDNDDRQTGVTSAYGTADAANDATASYTADGKVATLLDANGNLTTYEYDGFDRLAKTRYPDTTAGAGTSSTTDYEQLVYDPASNVTSRHLRGYAADSTQHIDYSYDHLERPTLKDLPGGELDVSYGYDLLGRLTSASTTAQTLTFGYDALSRMTTQGGPLGTMTSAYDLAGRRTQLTWPDAFYVNYDYDTAGNLLAVRENGAASGIGVLATMAYDATGRPHLLTYGNGATRTVSYDAVWRPATTINSVSGTAADETRTFTYNPASQIASVVRSNAYAYGGYADAAKGYSINGLNQATTAGSDTIGYDARGNTNTIGSSGYTYSSENLLLTGPNSASLSYDPLLRLYQTSATGYAATRFQYDGLNMAGEYDASGVLQKRYVAAGVDTPLVEYTRGTGGSYTRTWLLPDERGSIVSRSDDSATSTGINSYDEYGTPASGNSGRFGYTGQAWLPELGLWYYKARMYAPSLGRFLQTDPIGYGDGMNWYGYVKGDPTNATDPGGTEDTIYVKGPCQGYCYYGDAASKFKDGLDNIQRWVDNERNLVDSAVRGLEASGEDLKTAFCASLNTPITEQSGVSGTFGEGAGALVGSATVGYDPNGNVGLVFSGGVMAGFGGEISGGAYAAVSNARTLDDLSGEFYEGQGSVSAVEGVGVSGFYGETADGYAVKGGGLSATGGAGASALIGKTGSRVIKIFNLKDAAGC